MFLVEPYVRNYRKGNQKIQKSQDKWIPGNLIALPAKKCYECGKSCRVAPLLACDYCSLLYHLDCLNPPLTAPPSGTWMCPNHVEHALVNTLYLEMNISSE